MKIILVQSFLSASSYSDLSGTAGGGKEGGGGGQGCSPTTFNSGSPNARDGAQIQSKWQNADLKYCLHWLHILNPTTLKWPPQSLPVVDSFLIPSFFLVDYYSISVEQIEAQ